MKSKLALLGGTPEITKPLKPFTGISSVDKEAVMNFFDSNQTLSGFFGSARPEFFGGKEVKSFEEEWCMRFGVQHAVSVNSATSGLIAAMGAIGISPGDEVILPPMTMSATAIAPLFYGGIPIFADIEDKYYGINPIEVEKLITPRTRAIIAVNLFGHPADLHKLRVIADKHNVYLIEDNAQSILAQDNGALAGTIGNIGIYSLNVHKHIQTGEGGMCVTQDAELAKRLQLIRNHAENVIEWQDVEDLTNMVGYNFRMLEITAVIGRSQLKSLEYLVDRCEKIGNFLSNELRGLPGLNVPEIRENCSHNYFMWTAQFDEKTLGIPRSLYAKALRAEGVPVAEGYVKPIYWLSLFQERKAIGREGFPFTLSQYEYCRELCPVAERLHLNRILQFQPVAWNCDDNQLQSITAAFKKIHSYVDELRMVIRDA